jgi:Zn-dependent peptidase ImmA (M78 family)/transcriptional regulator with XRE-family HTH domain
MNIPRKELNSVFGTRLKTARKMAGMSLEDLARRTGRRVSRQAIHKYEQNRMRPSSDVLLELSKALDLKPDYFYRLSGVELERFSFRRKIGLPAKKEEALRMKTIDFLERYAELESLTGNASELNNPLKGMAIKSKGDIERAAEKLRVAWGFGNGPISGLFETIEDNGIRIYEVEEDDRFDGLSASAGRRFVIVVNRHKTFDRKRFTAAHELGHILCDFPQHEDDRCHAFAKSFLLPKDVFIREFMGHRKKISRQELLELKSFFGVSLQAILHRAFDLDLISARFRTEYERDLAKWNTDKAEPGTCSYVEKASRFQRLIHYSLAEGIVSLSKAAQLSGTSIAQLEREFQAS